MAQPETYTSASPRDDAALSDALTQCADRYLAYKQSVEAIIGAFPGVAIADLEASPYNRSPTVAQGLISGMGYLQGNISDANVNGFIAKIRNITR